MRINKKLLLIGLAVVIIVGGGLYYRGQSADAAKAKRVGGNFLKALYREGGAKTARELSTTTLQGVKSDGDLQATASSAQSVNSIKFTQVKSTADNTITLEGAMASTQPNQPQLDKESGVINNTFALRMVKENGEWRVDAYQVD